MNAFSWPGITRQSRGPLAEVHVDSSLCAASVLEQGAQLLRFRPSDGTDILWVSPRASFLAGKAVRGGIPLCFPWFGPHPSRTDLPQHGFVRTTPAAFGGSRARGDKVDLRFSREADQDTHWAFPHEFHAEIRFLLGEDLGMEIEVRNDDDDPFSYELALHTYFRVSDVEDVRLRGLENAPFVDKVRGGVQMAAEGVGLALRGEVDRVYTSSDDVRIEDKGLGRVLTVSKRGSGSTVVWNPGRERAAAMADVGDAWREFVCVEVGNIGAERVTLAPGETHITGMKVTSAHFG